MKVNVAKRTRIVCLILLTLLIFSLFATGCEQSANDSLWGTNSDSSDEPAPPIWMVYSTQKKNIDHGDDLNLLLYFLPLADYDHVFPSASSSISCEIQMKAYDQNSDPIDEKSKVVATYDKFSKDMYQSFTRNGVSYTSAIEEICVPSDWFLDQEGAISFFVNMNITLEDGSTFEEGSGISLYYAKTGDTIQLFSSYYSFANRMKINVAEITRIVCWILLILLIFSLFATSMSRSKIKRKQ